MKLYENEQNSLIQYKLKHIQSRINVFIMEFQDKMIELEEEKTIDYNKHNEWFDNQTKEYEDIYNRLQKEQMYNTAKQ